MELRQLIRLEWHDDHRLSRRSLAWIVDHADPGDEHPIATAIADLRAGDAQPVRPSRPAPHADADVHT